MSNIHFTLDSFGERYELNLGVFSIYGWAFADDVLIKEVYIELGEKKILCNYGFTRADVALHHKNFSPELTLKSGFAVSFKLDEVAFDYVKLEFILENGQKISKAVRHNLQDLKIKGDTRHSDESYLTVEEKNLSHILYNNAKLKKSGYLFHLYSPRAIIGVSSEVVFSGWFCDSDGLAAREIFIIINGENFPCSQGLEENVYSCLQKLALGKEANIAFSFSFVPKEEICDFSICVVTRAGEEILVHKGVIYNEPSDNFGEYNTPNEHIPILINYQKWLMENAINCDEVLAKVKNLVHKPLISVVMFADDEDYNSFLRASIESVCQQVYSNWELFIVVNAEGEAEMADLFNKVAGGEIKNKVEILSEKTLGKNASSNIQGEFVIFLSGGDVFQKNAFYEVASLLNQETNADYIYSDEDTISEKGFRDNVNFKPNWSPHYFYSTLYTENMSVIRRTVLEKAQVLDKIFSRDNFYEIIFKATEVSDKIHHVAKALYSRRKLRNPKGVEQKLRDLYWHKKTALINHLERKNINAKVLPSVSLRNFRIQYTVTGEPPVTILLPTAAKFFTRNNEKIYFIDNLLENIKATNTYKNIEVLCIENINSKENGVDKNLLKNSLSDICPVKWLTYTQEEFNLSEKLNLAAKSASGDFLLILNDDLEFNKISWLEELLAPCQQDEVGVVGSKLIFPDSRIQHAGVTFPAANPTHVFYRFPNGHNGYNFNLESLCNYSAVTGACMMTKTDIYKQLRGWNEKFAINYNDADYCLRVRELGYYVVYTPHCCAIHHESVSRKAGRSNEEINNFHARWKSKHQQDEFYNPNFPVDGCFATPKEK